jgi:hypothetical protein
MPTSRLSKEADARPLKHSHCHQGKSQAPEPPIWRDGGTSVVVGRKRAYPVDLGDCRVRLQVAGSS